MSVRHALLKRLKGDPHFGVQRIHMLSDFLLAYMKHQQLHNLNLLSMDFDRMRKWTALAYTEPKQAAFELAEALLTSIQLHDTTEQIYLSAVIETFSEPFKDAELVPLLTYGHYTGRFARFGEENTGALRDTEEAVLQLGGKLQIWLPTLKEIKEDQVIAPPIEPSLPPQEVLPLPSSPLPAMETLPPPDSQADSWYSNYATELYKRSKPRRKGICPSCSSEISFNECRIISGRSPGKILKQAPTDWRERTLPFLNLSILLIISWSKPNANALYAATSCPTI